MMKSMSSRVSQEEDEDDDGDGDVEDEEEGEKGYEKDRRYIFRQALR